MAIKNSSQKMRFMMVGGFNTLLDFGLLFLLKSFGLPVITANILSTTIAFCFSFFANKKFTFRSTTKKIYRQIILFIIATLFGLWVLQTIVISVAYPLLQSLEVTDEIALLIAKLIATVVSLIWNYLLYSRVVFKDEHADEH